MASALDYCPSDYVDCTADLPDVVVAACKSVGVDLIDNVFFCDPDAPGFSADDYASATALATALTARLKQTGTATITGYTGNAAIRKYEVFDGQKPFVEPTFVTAFGGLRFAKKTDRSIEFVDYDNSVANHEWHDKMNCYKLVRAWYTAGNFFYGGKDGIIMSFASWHGIIDSGDRPAEGFTSRLTWGARRTESKIARPANV